MAGIAYVVGNRNILSPWVIVCCLFLVSTFFAVVNVDKWQFTLSPVTVIVILGALASLGIGETLVSWLFQRGELAPHVVQRQREKHSSPLLNTRRPIMIPWLAIVLLIVLLCAMLVYYYRETYAFSLAGGNPGGTELMLKYAREAKLTRAVIPGRLYGHISLLAKAIGYVFIYIFLYNFIFFGFRLRWLPTLVPPLMYILFAILSTGRTEFIYLTGGIMMIGCFLLLKRENWSPRCTLKIILLAVIALAAFFLVFILSGFLTGKTSFDTAFNSISFYTGMSIPSLDYWILHPQPDTPYIGYHTLFPVYSTLRTFGFDLPVLYAPYEFVNFNGQSGNVYTAIRRYMEDFTVWGMLFMFAFLGALYSFLLNILRRRREPGFLLVLYAVFCYPLFELSIEERFFMNIFATSSVYLTAYLAIFYFAFVYYPRRLEERSPYLQRQQKLRRRAFSRRFLHFGRRGCL